MYTLTEVTVSRPLLISYIADKNHTTERAVTEYIKKGTLFTDLVEELVTQRTATLRELTELSEWYTIFTNDPATAAKGEALK